MYCLILNVGIIAWKIIHESKYTQFDNINENRGVKKVKIFWFTMSKYNLSFEWYDHSNFDL